MGSQGSNISSGRDIRLGSDCTESQTHARIQKVLSGGSNCYAFLFCFLIDEGREDPNTTVSRPALSCQRNAIKMAFCWCAGDGPTLNAGLVALCVSGYPDQYC